jgi:uncharacterized protein with PQ loop repeat
MGASGSGVAEPSIRRGFLPMRGRTRRRIVAHMDVAILAGVTSTGLFVMSYLPMLVKAARTKDLSSYSLGSLAMTNAGNLLYSVYVFSLPTGPIWFLHAFYVVASALMLAWFVRYREEASRHGSRRAGKERHA